MGAMKILLKTSHIVFTRVSDRNKCNSCVIDDQCVIDSQLAFEIQEVLREKKNSPNMIMLLLRIRL